MTSKKQNRRRFVVGKALLACHSTFVWVCRYVNVNKTLYILHEHQSWSLQKKILHWSRIRTYGVLLLQWPFPKLQRASDLCWYLGHNRVCSDCCSLVLLLFRTLSKISVSQEIGLYNFYDSSIFFYENWPFHTRVKMASLLRL